MRALYKPMLAAGLLAGTYNPVGPYVINVDPTHRCNMQCPWCRYHSPHLPKDRDRSGMNRDLNLEYFAAACRDLATMGTRIIQMVGWGEPLLHPRFHELVKIAKGHGFEVSLFTNGTLIDREQARRLVAGGIDNLNISLWASTKERYAKLLGQKAESRFESVTEGIGHLRQAKADLGKNSPNLILSYAVSRASIGDLESMLAWAQEAGMQGICLSVATVGKQLEPFRSSVLNREEELETVMRLEELAPDLQASGLKHNLEHVIHRLRAGEDAWREVPCNVGWFFASITVDGEVHACNRHHYKVGHLAEQSFREIWNGEKYRLFRKKSRDPKYLAGLSPYGDCNYCCHLPHNSRLHRFLRWWPPACGPG